MPNTLVHLATSVGPLACTRRWDGYLKWAYLGALLPDLPWIQQRIVLWATNADPYTLRAYCIAQASFACSVLLAGACACIVTHSRRVFGILVSMIALHLVLDSVQTKWANGVSWLAPIDWTLATTDWFVPESSVVYALSAVGILATVLTFRRAARNAMQWQSSSLRWIIGAGCLIAYMSLPWFWRFAPVEANNHFLAVLTKPDQRIGKAIELDRVRFITTPYNSVLLTTFAGETLALVGALPDDTDGTISVRGRFVDATTIEASMVHMHTPFLRAGASFAGVLIVLAVWLDTLLPTRSRS